MPVLIQTVPEVHHSITRPVTFSVISDLLKRTGIQDSTRIRYVGNSEALSQLGSTIDAQLRPNRLNTDQIVEIELTENYEESGILTTNPKNVNYPPIFTDEESGITLTPAYQLIQVQANVTLRCQDAVTASNWLRAIRCNVAQDVNTYLQLSEYHYVIPNVFMVLLTHFYNLKQNKFGFTQTLEEYLKDNLVEDFTVLRDSAGNNPTFAIRQTQGNVTGWFDFGADIPTPDRAANGTYSISFTYNYMYDRCDYVTLRCPLVIYNQMIPTGLVKDVLVKDVLDYYNQPTFAKKWLSGDPVHPLLQKPWILFCGVPYPFYDDWFPPQDLPHHENLLRILLQVDVNNPTDVLDLTQLPNWEFRSNYITYLKKRPNSLLVRYDNIFFVRLFENHEVFTDVAFTPDLKIVSTRPLNPKKYYHLCIDLLLDPNLLTEEGKRDYTDDPNIVKDHVSIIDPSINIDYDEDDDEFTVTRPNDPDKPPVVCLPPTKDTLTDVLSNITPTLAINRKPVDVFTFTRGLFSIVAHRSN